MGTYSHSRLSTFEQCPQKYKFGYIDEVETEIETTIEAFMGSRVHEVLEKLYKDIQFEKMNSLAELLAFYNLNWEKHWKPNILIVKQEYSEENYRKKGERMITDYYHRYAPFKDSKTIGLETQDFLELDENYKIHIRIDRLSCNEDGIYEIHDYKTANTLPTQQDIDEDRQLAIYSMGVKKLYSDAKQVILIWHYLAFDKELRSQRTVEQLDQLRREVLETIKKIENTIEFPPKQSALCNYCEYQKICPLWKHLYKIEELEPEAFRKDDGVRLVDEYVKAKEEEKEAQNKVEFIQGQIKSFSEQHGVKAVYGSTHQTTIWSKDTYKFPGKSDPERKEFIKVLKALNLYDRYLDFDNWAFEKDFDMLTHIEKEVLKKIARKEKIMRLYLKERMT